MKYTRPLICHDDYLYICLWIVY